MLGIFLLSGNTLLAEACTYLPLDFVVIDAEAAPLSYRDIFLLVQVMKSKNLEVFVRVSEKSTYTIEHILDFGVAGIIVPKVESKKDAEKIVNAAYYPPQGNRGVNPVRVSNYFTNLPDYFKTANKSHKVFIQIESQEGIDNLDEILTVDGIHGVFIGPGDLSSSLGQIGEVANEKIRKVIDAILEKVKAANLTPGIFAYSTELAQEYKKKGFRFIAIGNDIKLFNESVINKVKAITEDE